MTNQTNPTAPTWKKLANGGSSLRTKFFQIDVYFEKGGWTWRMPTLRPAKPFASEADARKAALNAAVLYMRKELNALIMLNIQN